MNSFTRWYPDHKHGYTSRHLANLLGQFYVAFEDWTESHKRPWLMTEDNQVVFFKEDVDSFTQKMYIQAAQKYLASATEAAA